MKTFILIIISLTVGVAFGYFFRNYQFTHNRRNIAGGFPNNNQIQFRPGQKGNRIGGAAIGEIAVVNDTSLIVKTVDGSSKIILITGQTEINKADKAGKDDLQIGEKISIFGTENPDGSINAQNIQLNPLFRQNTPAPSIP